MQLRNIGAIRQYLSDESASHVVHAFVTSRLDYCNALLGGISKTILARLKRVQNHAARIVTLSRKHKHITLVLKMLHWLPVNLRIEYKILLLTYKILHGAAPAYLTDLVNIYTPTRSLRSAEEELLVVPRSRTTHYGDRAFSILAPKLWNNLPHNIKEASSVPTFKKRLKTYLFQKF